MDEFMYYGPPIRDRERERHSRVTPARHAALSF
jgi:hypothetical protein